MAELLKRVLHLLVCCFELPYVLFYDLKTMVNDVAAIKLRDEFCRLKSEHPGQLRTNGAPKRAAIIAIHPSDESIPFTLNLLDALATNDFYILAVHNKPMSDEQRSAILSRCHHLIACIASTTVSAHCRES
jgi:hypothetical protein